MYQFYKVGLTNIPRYTRKRMQKSKIKMRT